MIQDINYKQYEMSVKQYNRQFYAKRPVIYLYIPGTSVYIHIDVYPYTKSYYHRL